MRPFLLPQRVADQTEKAFKVEFPLEDYHHDFGLVIGSVRLEVLRHTKKPIVKFLLDEKSIALDLAKKLLTLNSNSLFTFETIRTNAAVFLDFADAVCLKSILSLKKVIHFHPDHTLFLEKDVSETLPASIDLLT
jgi:hypothetical protein